MKPATLRRKAVGAAVEAAVILVLHFVLIRALAGSDVVATILSAGPHAPAGCLAAAGFFLLVRTAAVLLLPGIVLSRLVGLLLLDWSREPAGANGESDKPKGAG